MIAVARVNIVAYITKSIMLDDLDPTKNGIKYAKINANPRSTLDLYTREITTASPVLRMSANVANQSEKS